MTSTTDNIAKYLAVSATEGALSFQIGLEYTPATDEEGDLIHTATVYLLDVYREKLFEADLEIVPGEQLGYDVILTLADRAITGAGWGYVRGAKTGYGRPDSCCEGRSVLCLDFTAERL
jgi:hypothetical protein